MNFLWWWITAELETILLISVLFIKTKTECGKSYYEREIFQEAYMQSHYDYYWQNQLITSDGKRTCKKRKYHRK